MADKFLQERLQSPMVSQEDEDELDEQYISPIPTALPYYLGALNIQQSAGCVTIRPVAEH